jgi:hypothetical protein
MTDDSSTPSDESSQTAESAGSDSDSGSSEDFPGSDDPTQISDDQLPEDLRPTEDNPLAKPADDDDEDSGMNVQEQAGDAGAPG